MLASCTAPACLQVTIKNVHVRFEDLWDETGAAPRRSPASIAPGVKHRAIGVTLQHLEVRLPLPSIQVHSAFTLTLTLTLAGAPCPRGEPRQAAR